MCVHQSLHDGSGVHLAAHEDFTRAQSALVHLVSPIIAKGIRIYNRHSGSKMLIDLEGYFRSYFSTVLVQTRVHMLSVLEVLRLTINLFLEINCL